MRRASVIALAIALAVGAAPPVQGLPLDGATPIICAATTVLECDAGGTCRRITPETANMPAFVTIDVPGRTLRASEDGGRQTRIHEVQQVDGRLVLQGAEGGRAWNMLIDDTGILSVAVVEAQATFAVFGRCMAPVDLGARRR